MNECCPAVKENAVAVPESYSLPDNVRAVHCEYEFYVWEGFVFVVNIEGVAENGKAVYFRVICLVIEREADKCIPPPPLAVILLMRHRSVRL